MTERSFRHLLKILEDDLKVNIKQSTNSTSGNGAITAEMKLAIGLRYMGGEKLKSLADIFRISMKSADRAIDSFLNAVDSCKHQDLDINLLPEKEMDRNRMAVEWNQRSGAYHIFYGMLGAIDGWLCTTERPSDVQNPSKFFSGHYQRFGFNCQAVCDANCRFIYFAVAGPGKANDARVFRKLTRLRHWLQALSPGFFIIGDNAYQLTNSLLIPFSGADTRDDNNDAYNFYLSQLRTCIEMSFGRLTGKWRIFRSDLSDANGSEKNTKIIRVGAKLHNFVINSDQLNFINVDDNDWTTLGVEALRDGPEGNKGYLPIPFEEEEDPLSFNRRTFIVNEITERELRRPTHNVERNL